ncbi:hypothetical protein BLNAU_9166 [Blattamonas nauphoetae]|uniref:HECT-type E3 ubiquitin transferase n=1 Tax=Blattamonas nauphoetae TaxID=2049346 RepID=A0ABQ9XWF4_9EUKA|nr:hypothetical protein BLNAU_9166 [Blattamonas nauphoetae]
MTTTGTDQNTQQKISIKDKLLELTHAKDKLTNNIVTDFLSKQRSPTLQLVLTCYTELIHTLSEQEVISTQDIAEENPPLQSLISDLSTFVMYCAENHHPDLASQGFMVLFSMILDEFPQSSDKEATNQLESYRSMFAKVSNFCFKCSLSSLTSCLVVVSGQNSDKIWQFITNCLQASPHQLCLYSLIYETASDEFLQSHSQELVHDLLVTVDSPIQTPKTTHLSPEETLIFRCRLLDRILKDSPTYAQIAAPRFIHVLLSQSKDTDPRFAQLVKDLSEHVTTQEFFHSELLPSIPTVPSPFKVTSSPPTSEGPKSQTESPNVPAPSRPSDEEDDDPYDMYDEPTGSEPINKTPTPKPSPQDDDDDPYAEIGTDITEDLSAKTSQSLDPPQNTTSQNLLTSQSAAHTASRTETPVQETLPPSTIHTPKDPFSIPFVPTATPSPSNTQTPISTPLLSQPQSPAPNVSQPLSSSLFLIPSNRDAPSTDPPSLLMKEYAESDTLPNVTVLSDDPRPVSPTPNMTSSPFQAFQRPQELPPPAVTTSSSDTSQPDEEDPPLYEDMLLADVTVSPPHPPVQVFTTTRQMLSLFPGSDYIPTILSADPLDFVLPCAFNAPSNGFLPLGPTWGITAISARVIRLNVDSYFTVNHFHSLLHNILGFRAHALPLLHQKEPFPGMPLEMYADQLKASTQKSQVTLVSRRVQLVTQSDFKNWPGSKSGEVDELIHLADEAQDLDTKRAAFELFSVYPITQTESFFRYVQSLPTLLFCLRHSTANATQIHHLHFLKFALSKLVQVQETEEGSMKSDVFGMIVVSLGSLLKKNQKLGFPLENFVQPLLSHIHPIFHSLETQSHILSSSQQQVLLALQPITIYILDRPPKLKNETLHLLSDLLRTMMNVGQNCLNTIAAEESEIILKRSDAFACDRAGRESISLLILRLLSSFLRLRSSQNQKDLPDVFSTREQALSFTQSLLSVFSVTYDDQRLFVFSSSVQETIADIAKMLLPNSPLFVEILLSQLTTPKPENIHLCDDSESTSSEDSKLCCTRSIPGFVLIKDLSSHPCLSSLLHLLYFCDENRSGPETAFADADPDYQLIKDIFATLRSHDSPDVDLSEVLPIEQREDIVNRASDENWMKECFGVQLGLSSSDQNPHLIITTPSEISASHSVQASSTPFPYWDTPLQYHTQNQDSEGNDHLTSPLVLTAILAKSREANTEHFSLIRRLPNGFWCQITTDDVFPFEEAHIPQLFAENGGLIAERLVYQAADERTESIKLNKMNIPRSQMGDAQERIKKSEDQTSFLPSLHSSLIHYLTTTTSSEGLEWMKTEISRFLDTFEIDPSSPSAQPSLLHLLLSKVQTVAGAQWFASKLVEMDSDGVEVINKFISRTHPPEVTNMMGSLLVSSIPVLAVNDLPIEKPRTHQKPEHSPKPPEESDDSDEVDSVEKEDSSDESDSLSSFDSLMDPPTLFSRLQDVIVGEFQKPRSTDTEDFITKLISELLSLSPIFSQRFAEQNVHEYLANSLHPTDGNTSSTPTARLLTYLRLIAQTQSSHPNIRPTELIPNSLVEICLTSGSTELLDQLSKSLSIHFSPQILNESTTKMLFSQLGRLATSDDKTVNSATRFNLSAFQVYLNYITHLTDPASHPTLTVDIKRFMSFFASPTMTDAFPSVCQIVSSVIKRNALLRDFFRGNTDYFIAQLGTANEQSAGSVLSVLLLEDETSLVPFSFAQFPSLFHVLAWCTKIDLFRLPQKLHFETCLAVCQALIQQHKSDSIRMMNEYTWAFFRTCLPTLRRAPPESHKEVLKIVEAVEIQGFSLLSQMKQPSLFVLQKCEFIAAFSAAPRKQMHKPITAVKIILPLLSTKSQDDQVDIQPYTPLLLSFAGSLFLNRTQTLKPTEVHDKTLSFITKLTNTLLRVENFENEDISYRRTMLLLISMAQSIPTSGFRKALQTCVLNMHTISPDPLTIALVLFTVVEAESLWKDMFQPNRQNDQLFLDNRCFYQLRPPSIHTFMSLSKTLITSARQPDFINLCWTANHPRHSIAALPLILLALVEALTELTIPFVQTLFLDSESIGDQLFPSNELVQTLFFLTLPIFPNPVRMPAMSLISIFSHNNTQLIKTIISAFLSGTHRHTAEEFRKLSLSSFSHTFCLPSDFSAFAKSLTSFSLPEAVNQHSMTFAAPCPDNQAPVTHTLPPILRHMICCSNSFDQPDEFGIAQPSPNSLSIFGSIFGRTILSAVLATDTQGTVTVQPSIKILVYATLCTSPYQEATLLKEQTRFQNKFLNKVLWDEYQLSGDKELDREQREFVKNVLQMLEKRQATKFESQNVLKLFTDSPADNPKLEDHPEDAVD